MTKNKPINYLDSRTSAERKEDRKIKAITTMGQKAQENWKDEIRLGCAGIIPPEQIEATIIFWEDFISDQIAKARQEERSKILEEIEGLPKLVKYQHTKIDGNHKRKSCDGCSRENGFKNAISQVLLILNQKR